jgi:hypothetical protein
MAKEEEEEERGEVMWNHLQLRSVVQFTKTQAVVLIQRKRYQKYVKIC